MYYDPKKDPDIQHAKDGIAMCFLGCFVLIFIAMARNILGN